MDQSSITVLQDILRPKFPDQSEDLLTEQYGRQYNMMAEMERSYTYNQTD